MIWLLLACSTPSPRSDAPTVVWITVDTLRADHLGYAGHDSARTPHIDALAARGRRYSHATTPLPRTTPALASALTGRLPEHHGSEEVGDPIRADVPTVADAFRAAGWHTTGISAMPVAGPDQGFDRGFDRFEVHYDLPAPELVAKALSGLPDRPRFLWIHMSDPHFPYLPPGATGPCATAGEKARDGKLKRVELFANVGGQSDALLADCTRLYDGEIAEVDRAIGQLLDAIGGDPWVVFSADHGEHLGEQGLYFEHGPTVHPADLRIPLIIAGPGIPTGDDASLAQLQDLAPTSLAHAGLPVPDGLDGLDLFAAPPRTVATARSGSALQQRLTSVLVSGRGERWCLNGPRFSWCTAKRGTALHDRDADPRLGTDVSAAHPEVAKAMASAATRWGPEQAREVTAFDTTHFLVGRPALEGGYRVELVRWDGTPSDEEPSSPLASALALPEGREAQRDERSDEDLERLRALGYVE